MQTLYTLLYLHLLPLFVLRMYWRARKAPAYAQRMKERFALVPKRQSAAPLFWLHAVSVGEVIAAIPLVHALQKTYPQAEICITTTTPTGSDRVRAAFADTVLHYYLPYDVPSIIHHFIRSLRPDILMIMETELWPNVIAVSKQLTIPVLLVNGRMSASSAKGYKRLSVLTKPMLQSMSLIAAQSQADATRYVELGASSEKVKVLGSVKFDVEIDSKVKSRKQAIESALDCHDRRIVVFASTHPGEDEQLLPMIKSLNIRYPDLLAIVVPRHPERFDVVANLARSQAISFQLLTDSKACSKETAMVIANTMGDMLAIYGIADVAFVGGSLIDHGGHNFLEAACWGLPIFSGHSIFNFQTIADEMAALNALQLVSDVDVLEKHLQDWLSSSAEYEAMGVAAKQYIKNNGGVVNKIITEMAVFLPSVAQANASTTDNVRN